MALFGSDTLRALSAGGYGANLAADTLLRQLEAQARSQAIAREQQSQQANDIWGKAIADLLAGSGQTDVPPPIPPQPGQPSTPMTQPGQSTAAPTEQVRLAGGPPGTNWTLGAEGFRRGAEIGGPPSPARQVLQGGPPPGNPAQAVLQGQQPQMPPQGGPMMSPIQGLDYRQILRGIMKSSPNLPPGVLSAVVDQHILPLMDQQSKLQYTAFKQQLDMMKATNEQQDKMLQLYFHYDQLSQRAEDNALNRDQRAQAAQQANETRLEIARMADTIRQESVKSMNAYRKDSLDLRQQELDLKKQSATSLNAYRQVQTDNLKSLMQNRKDKAAALAPSQAAQMKILENQERTYTQQIDTLINMGATDEGSDPNSVRLKALRGQLDTVIEQQNEMYDKAGAGPPKNQPLPNQPTKALSDAQGPPAGGTDVPGSSEQHPYLVDEKNVLTTMTTIAQKKKSIWISINGKPMEVDAARAKQWFLDNQQPLPAGVE